MLNRPGRLRSAGELAGWQDALDGWPGPRCLRIAAGMAPRVAWAGLKPAARWTRWGDGPQSLLRRGGSSLLAEYRLKRCCSRQGGLVGRSPFFTPRLNTCRGRVIRMTAY